MRALSTVWRSEATTSMANSSELASSQPAASPLLMLYRRACGFCTGGEVGWAVQALKDAFRLCPPEHLTDTELTVLEPLQDDLFYLGQLLPDLRPTLELARRFLLSTSHPLPHHG